MARRTLFELGTGDGCSISPYVWRAKFALAHKRLPYDTVLVGFTDIPDVGPGGFRLLPVLEDEGRWIGDSWAIAAYLDEAYPEAPPLFATPAEHALALFFENWISFEVVSRLFRICAFDIYGRLSERDRSYFRNTREPRLRSSLEVAHGERDKHISALREGLQPLRLSIKGRPFVGGEAPSYADYIAAGALIWGGSVATVELLPPEDDLLEWLRRCLEFHGGVGASLHLPGLSGFSV